MLRNFNPSIDYINELASLTWLDSDIATLASRPPQQHLVGIHVGPIRVSIFAASTSSVCNFDSCSASEVRWIAPDDALHDHASLVLRIQHFPNVNSIFRAISILTAGYFIA